VVCPGNSYCVLIVLHVWPLLMQVPVVIILTSVVFDALAPFSKLGS
jgi:hypothetical protein